MIRRKQHQHKQKEKCVIVIPVHSAEPTLYEQISFSQCFKILYKYPLKVVAPKGLDLTAYKNVVGKFDTIYIHPSWQSSVIKYNKLKLSNYFYDLFDDYEYLLTYELDAFVFKDDLNYWFDKRYDYIGAPWFEGYSNPTDLLIGVGNSGFSMRNIKATRVCLRKYYYKDPALFTRGKSGYFKALFKFPVYYLSSVIGAENYSIQDASWIHEDNVLNAFFSLPSNHYKLAPIEDAVKFSFEVKPEVLYKLNNNELPTGCHAWWRYNFSFWKPFIEGFGYQL